MQALTFVDITEQHADLLPARNTMYFDINVAPVVAVNMAIAVNAATIGSQANAVAGQFVGVWQQ